MALASTSRLGSRRELDTAVAHWWPQSLVHAEPVFGEPLLHVHVLWRVIQLTRYLSFLLLLLLLMVLVDVQSL